MNSTPYSYEEDRMRILRMVEEGKISASQGVSLLDALGKETSQPPQSELPQIEQPPSESAAPGQEALPARNGPRWFRVRVRDLVSGRDKVTVNLPLAVVDWGMRMGARFAPEAAGLDWGELSELLRSGADGKLVEVMDEEDGEHVEIYVE